MIDQALDFLCNQINNYLSTKLDPAPSGDAIILFNVSNLADGNSNGNGNTTASNAFLTLINVEENRVSKVQENFLRTHTSVTYNAPEVYLNS